MIENYRLPHQSPDPEFKIIFAGNIGASQGFETVVAAASRLKVTHPGIHWYILGEGRMKEWLENEIHSLGLQSQVHLLGRFPVEAMPYFFAQADALLVTLRNEEIFSLTIPAKLQSYLACGKPIIAALSGEGAAVVAESGAGVTCEPEQADQLAQAILKMKSLSPSERAEMGLKGRKYYEVHFSSKKLLDDLVCWMEESASRSRF